MKLYFKNRIALFNTLAAAITMLVVFAAVYAVVYITTYHYLDNNIREEKEELFSQITTTRDSLILGLNAEWEELEHNRAEVDPIFLQIVDNRGVVIFHSRNLENDQLQFADSLTNEQFFNVALNGKIIRQGQFPIKTRTGQIIGQLDIGVSQVDSMLILSNLRNTFFATFPLMLIFFYIVTSLVASRSIAPVKQLISYAEKMNYNNINPKLPLPVHQDEIYQLTATINALLERIEMGRNREKQITSDISHELWTPLTSIKGTLEVLIRKPRDPQKYQEKIVQVIQEVDDMNHTVNQLLYLARLDAGNINIIKKQVNLYDIMVVIRNRWNLQLQNKQMILQLEIPEDTMIQTDFGLLEIILGNLVGNAVKYGYNQGLLVCRWHAETGTLSISDNGPGIPQEHLPHIFERFYRVNVPESSSVQGTGLGLYMVKNLAEIQGINITVESKVNEGTQFDLHFIDNES
ncbi:MAG: HAMP domain-containing sensor histidine kinase [Paludibacter sp.]|nr:HAMP domain-containing sensor histidine kinase [Paludibacter sp.]